MLVASAVRSPLLKTMVADLSKGFHVEGPPAITPFINNGAALKPGNVIYAPTFRPETLISALPPGFLMIVNKSD